MFCHAMSYGASFSTAVAIMFQSGIFAMFTFEKRFTYQLRTAVGQFGAIEAHYLYMLVLVLRGFIGPKMVTTGFTIFTPLLIINFQNVMLVIGICVLINGTLVTFITAYKAAKADDVTKQCLYYFASISQSYICLLCIIPFTEVYKNLPITCIIVICSPMIKL
mmetsp:Transcript_20009/g.17679  ORF Transcript_20009/g.17679 Transcript_20009/m.17679 type:complete len:163 (+) Transcript_20009:385-873(+)